MRTVNVYENEYMDKVVARVQYNELLDVWNGSNWSNGGVGRHLGITKLRDGRFVLIHGTQWDGEKDYGMIVTDAAALNAILQSDKEDLLSSKRFASLQERLTTHIIPECA